MGAELPVERICQPKPWLCTTHQFWCVRTITDRHDKFVQRGVRPPYFGGELDFSAMNECKTIFGARSSTKTMSCRFSPSWHNPKFGDWSPGRWKSAWHFFLDDCAPQAVCLNFAQPNASPPPKYEDQTPKNAFRISKTVIWTNPKFGHIFDEFNICVRIFFSYFCRQYDWTSTL